MVRFDARDHAAAGPERRRHARHAAAGGAAYGDPVRTAVGRGAAAVLAEAGLGPRSLARTGPGHLRTAGGRGVPDSDGRWDDSGRAVVTTVADRAGGGRVTGRQGHR